MKTLSPALQAILAAAGPYVLADLYTITLTNGTIFHWTNTQRSITVGGITFSPGPPISRGQASWSLGLSVDNLQIVMEDDGSATINSLPLVMGAREGLLDLAEITVDRFISDTWANTAVGKVNVFTGRAGDIKVEGKKVFLTVESGLAELKSTFPRTYILPSCANTLYDGVCELLETNFTIAGTVGGIPTATSFILEGVTEPDDYYQLGTIRFTSGANNGQVRTVKSYTAGVIALIFPLYSVPVVGDTVNAIAGCDKTRAVCLNRFNNMVHFRGFPFVPDPSTQYTGTSSTSTSTSTSTGTGGGGGGGAPWNRGGRGGHGIINQK